jgi:hypothetical protein
MDGDRMKISVYRSIDVKGSLVLFSNVVIFGIGEGRQGVIELAVWQLIGI